MENLDSTFWDKVSPRYAHIDLSKELERSLTNFFDRFIRPNISCTNKMILDYGCGGGYFAKWLYSSYSGISYYGYDVSQRSLEAASLKEPRGYYSQSLPLVDVDIIFSLAVIQHMTTEDYKTFIDFCETSNAKEIFIQFRYSREYTYRKHDFLNRLSMPDVYIPGYELTYESPVFPGNRYKYSKYDLCI